MIPNPILKVLSMLSSHEVRYLLMGGQACVFYGAAEFSRDCDIVIVADEGNLGRLQLCLNDLLASRIALPPFEVDYLSRGHAVHFRCQHPDAKNIRVDVMNKMRGCEDFERLWERRLTLQDSDGSVFEILGIEDLVKAKKTQCDKDWPMIRRLIDAHYNAYKTSPTEDQILFWFRESRNSDVLLSLATTYPKLCSELRSKREALEHASVGNEVGVNLALDAEESNERLADEAYWRPLKAELELLRSERRAQ